MSYKFVEGGLKQVCGIDQDLCLCPAAHVEVQREASSPADPVRGHGLRGGGAVSGRRPSGQGEGGVSERAGESRRATQPATHPHSQPG